MWLNLASPWDAVLLAAAAALAGALNAVAGGGSFLTLPALAWVGVPLVQANATGTAALLPGYLASAWAFRRELAQPMTPSLPRLALVAAVGGALGAAWLMATSDRAFGRVVPWLLLAATAMFAFGPRLLRRFGGPGHGPSGAGATSLGIFAVSVYGGYFNGGLGILLLAALSLLGHADMNRMNGIKNLVSAILTVIAVSLYAAHGAIAWPLALWMAVSATVGGYAGARLARRLRPGVVRGFVVVTGLVMTALFFARQA